MKKINYFLVLALLIVSCQGDEGEIGPAGPQGEQGIQGLQGIQGTPGQNGKDAYEKLGFVEGTITGVRRDGIPFNETFKYEYSNLSYSNGFKFDNALGKYFYIIDRRLSPGTIPYFIMYCEVANKDQANETLVLNTTWYYYVDLDFLFEKELDPNTLFSLRAGARSETLNFIYPVNPTLNNSTYKFAINDNGYYDPSVIFDSFTQKASYVSRTTDGKTVFYEDPNTNFEPLGNYSYGKLIKVLNSDGSIGSNSPYDEIVLTRKVNDLIFRNNSGLDLSSNIVLPGDSFVISNYQKNQTTGVLTFDFEVTIGALGRPNSTTNPITMTGKFNSGGKVYTNIVSRK